MDERIDYDPSMVPEGARGLRLVRVDIGHGRSYESVEFESGRTGCELYIRRVNCIAGLLKDSPFLIDVLDKNEDILETFSTTAEGFKYLLRKLKCRVVWGQPHDRGR